ncbi:G patch domain-containing protein 4 [Chlorella vulgaris]
MKLPPGHVAGHGVVKPKCTGGFGERLMRTMGWQDGQGLGKEGTGITEAIQVKQKEDTVGVGGKGGYAWGDKWWEKAFDSAVMTVDESSSSDSSDSDSDDERMAAIAASVNHDGTRTSASVAELKLLASLSKKGGRAAAGRFGGRGGKLDRIRQQEAAMAEAATSKAAAATAAPGSSQQSDTTSEVLLSAGSSKKRKAAAAASGEVRETSVASGKADQEGGKKRRKNGKALAAADADAGGDDAPAAPAAEQVPKKPRIVIEAKCVASAPSHPFVPTPATGWWGAKRFASAGCLEGLDKAAAEAQRRRMTFDEDDQARIFTTAHATKTQGKVGLGQGTGTIKVGGVKWQGKRVNFAETDGGKSAEAREAAAAGGGTGLAAIGSSTQLDALAAKGKQKRKAAAAQQAQQQQQGQQQEQPAVTDEWQGAVKWRKIICQQLQEAAQQQLKVKQLQRLVVAAVLAKHGNTVASKAAVKAAFASKLDGSSKWVVEDSMVRLSS